MASRRRPTPARGRSFVEIVDHRVRDGPFGDARPIVVSSGAVRRGGFISASWDFKTLGAFFCNTATRRGTKRRQRSDARDRPRRCAAGRVRTRDLSSRTFGLPDLFKQPAARPTRGREGTTCWHINTSFVFQKENLEISLSDQSAMCCARDRGNDKRPRRTRLAGRRTSPIPRGSSSIWPAERISLRARRLRGRCSPRRRRASSRRARRGSPSGCRLGRRR
jgi:hypothetical protein